MKLLLYLACAAISLQVCAGVICYTCHNARDNEECIRTGVVEDCQEYNAICENQIRYDQNDPTGNGIIIEKRCKQRLACDNNVDQNIRRAYPIQCNLRSPTSVCRCCCETDFCNMGLLECWNDIRQYPAPFNNECRDFPKQPRNGVMQCNGNKEPGSYCNFQCHGGFYRVGPRTTNCMENLQWDYPAPECRPIRCNPPRRFLGNGTVRCSNSNLHRSICTYRCQEDYLLVGGERTECQDVGNRDGTGQWSSPVPYCRPLVCPEQGPILHGSISCSRGRRFRSQCRFTCEPEYNLFPPDLRSNRCIQPGQWSSELPCCDLPCPPFAVMDFAVILDSSSSVGAENWILMKEFVEGFLDDFEVRPDAAHFAVVRYNGVVDSDTQILFNDYPDSLQGVLDAFDRIPYDGSGTRTGNALNYTRDVLLTVGNRPGARDIVLLITDGASQDDVVGPAQRVRDTGALVLVLPIQPPGGNIDLEEIRAIAGPGNDHNIITDALEGGFGALDESLVAQISRLLCGAPCTNRLHEHEEL